MLLIRVLLLSLLASVSLGWAGSAAAIDFVVDDATSDADDDTPDDAVCETAAGTCSLRAAIEEANEQTGPHTITFAPAITAINLTASLPDIRAQIVIDGTNAGAIGGRVDINGGAVNGVGGFDCFDFISTGTSNGVIENPDGGQGSTLSNMVIRNCTDDAINASGHGYTFANNRIGTTPAGDAAAPNDGDGIDLSGTIPAPAIPDIQGLLDSPPTSFGEIAAFATALQGALTVIANPNFITGNHISGNLQTGITLNNPMTVNTFVAGNIVGLSADSLSAIPNGTGGGAPDAVVLSTGAYGNFIGPGNIISGNSNTGIRVSGAVLLPNFIMGNLVGPGGAPGLELGNGENGIFISATVEDDGTAPDNPTGYSTFIGPANVVSDNQSDNGGGALDVYGSDTSGGILVSGEGVRIYGNAIGLFAFPAGAVFGPADQLLDVGNSGNGIVLTTSGHEVGGSEVFEANFILHNERHGILVRGSGTVGNVIRGNFIGVAPPTGLDVFNLGNTGNGIVVHSASGTIIGGPGDLDDNVIAGNGINGIALRNGSAGNGWANLIQRNQIYGNGVTTPGVGIGIDLEHDINVPDVQPDPAGDDPNTNYSNYGQNQPTICTGAGVPLPTCTAPVFDAGSGVTTSAWTIETRPDTTLRIEYFSQRPDGMTFLYDEMVTTGPAGTPLSGTMSTCVMGLCTSAGTAGGADTRGQSIVMTATDLFPADVPPIGSGPVNESSNNTSEFSAPAGIPQEVAFSLASDSVNESAGTVDIVVQRLGDPVGTVTVEVVLAAAPGTATGGGVDYDLVSVNPITWNDGDGADKTFTLSITTDNLDENDETVNLELQNPTGAIEGTPNATTLTIVDDDPAPTIGIADNSVAEGDVGVQLPFTVSLSAVTSFDVVVTYSTADGSATAPADYTAQTSQIVTILAGNLDATINVDIAGDLLDEDDETFLVDIVSATNTTVAGSDLQAIGTITDNDPLPQLSINDVGPLDEGDGPAATPFNFMLSLDAPSGRAVSVRVTTGDVADTATAPEDYAAINPLVVIPAGMTSVPVTVDVVGDTVFEPLPTETFSVNLAADAVQPLNAMLVDALGIGIITNDDLAPAPDLSIVKSHAGNFTQGQTGATYTITVGNSADAPTDGTLVTVTDTLPAGLTATAISGTGWTCVLGTLSCTRTDVLPVSSSYPAITLTVDVAGNATSPQVNMVSVSGGGDASAGNNTAMDSTVIDGAPASPDLSIVKSHAGNFTQGQTGATYTITVSNSADAPTDGTLVTVADTLPAGLTATAISGTGWTCVLGTLSCTRTDVLPVSSSYPPITLTVDVAGNATSPQVNMVTVSGGGDTSPGSNSSADSTIVLGAPAGMLEFTPSPANQSVLESAGTATFLVARSGGSTGGVSVVVALGGTATSPADYSNSTTTLDWPDGDSSNRSITFNLVDDVLAEGNETVVLSLGAPSGGATLGANSVATLTIVDNDGTAVLPSPVTIPSGSRWSLLLLVLLMLGVVARLTTVARNS